MICFVTTSEETLGATSGAGLRRKGVGLAHQGEHLPGGSAALWCLCALLAIFSLAGCQERGEDTARRYVGMPKKVLWNLLCETAGEAGTAIKAYDYPEGVSGRRREMLYRHKQDEMPALFAQAKRWRWDSPEVRVHDFMFDVGDRVVEARAARTKRH